MAELFVDTNVFVRHLTQDHPEQSPRATAFLSRIERGEVSARTSDTVIFEIVYLLAGRYGRTRTEIASAVISLLELPFLELSNRQQAWSACQRYMETNMSFPDAHHVALMEQLGIEEIASFDRDFDRVPGIKRVEPS